MIPEQWTSSLIASSREFREVWDGTERSSWNQIYTCKVKLMLKLWYITWEGRQKRGYRKKTRGKRLENKLLKKRNPWLLVKLLRPSYSGYAEDSFYVLFSQFFFQTTHDRYLFSKIRLVLSSILYKFIVWACWAKTQSCLGSKAKPVLTFFVRIVNLGLFLLENESWCRLSFVKYIKLSYLFIYGIF